MSDKRMFLSFFFLRLKQMSNRPDNNLSDPGDIPRLYSYSTAAKASGNIPLYFILKFQEEALRVEPMSMHFKGRPQRKKALKFRKKVKGLL